MPPYSKKYIKSLSANEVRNLSDKDLYKYQKLYKIHSCGACPPYTPTEIAYYINKMNKNGRDDGTKRSGKFSRRRRSPIKNRKRIGKGKGNKKKSVKTKRK